ncbi:immunoglobulin I-set domain protein, partial [Dictyocaulus viviparus]
WLKDGIDVKSNMDYRQDFVNGIASLVIEETFIEDTATYTVRAENEGGVVESSAKLIFNRFILARSTGSSLLEEEKPRFIKQLTNVQVEEGETAQLDCVVVGRPEPEVIWFKEEKTVQEDERIHLTFVIPKKQPPPTPPKPVPRQYKPPTIQPTLTTTSCEEGGTVNVHGEPYPRVEWRFNDQPIQTSETIKIEEGYDGWTKLVISPAAPVHSGIYSVVAENEMGETTTAAVLHVQPRTKRMLEYEHMVEEDAYERLKKSIVTKEEHVDKEEMHVIESKIEFSNVKIFAHNVLKMEGVVVIFGLMQFDEIVERPPQPLISEQKETRTAETYMKMVDDLMREALPQATKTTSHTSTTTEYVQKVSEELPPPQIEKTTTHVSTELYNVGIYYESTPPPLVKQTMRSSSSEALHQAIIQQTPQPPESYKATKTSEVVERVHAATIRRTPVPELHKATITGAVSVENIATIQQPSTPELHRATIKPGTSVENIAAIHQSTAAPEIYRASVSPGTSIENVAAIREVPAPEIRQSSVSRGLSVENVAAIRKTSIPECGQASITALPVVESIGTIRQSEPVHPQSATKSSGAMRENVAQINVPLTQPDRQELTTSVVPVDRIHDIVVPKYQPHSTTYVSQTITDEGHIYRVDQSFEPSITTTTDRQICGNTTVEGMKTVAVEDGETTVAVKKEIIDEKVDDELRLFEEKKQELREPERVVSKAVQQTTSAEGWVQHEFDEISQPQAVQTTKRYETEHTDFQTQQ